MAEHEPSVGATCEWFTPPEIFEALGLEFDLDPCSPGPGHWVPARKIYMIKRTWGPIYALVIASLMAPAVALALRAGRVNASGHLALRKANVVRVEVVCQPVRNAGPVVQINVELHEARHRERLCWCCCYLQKK